MVKADRVVQRYLEAGYTGWDPPDYGDEPDPSDLWESIQQEFPNSMRKLLDRPKKTEDSRRGRTSVKWESEVDLSDEDDLGFTITVEAHQGTDADEDGLHSYSGIEAEYYFIVGKKDWNGEGEGRGFESKFKADLKAFLEELKRRFPEVAKQYRLR